MLAHLEVTLGSTDKAARVTGLQGQSLKEEKNIEIFYFNYFKLMNS